jgi:hypothetical protein
VFAAPQSSDARPRAQLRVHFSLSILSIASSPRAAMQHA